MSFIHGAGKPWQWLSLQQLQLGWGTGECGQTSAGWCQVGCSQTGPETSRGAGPKTSRKSSNTQLLHQKIKRARCNLTVVNDALVQKLLHDLDGRVPVHRLLVLDEPVDELLGNEAVGVRAQVVPPVLDHLPFMEPQPDRQTGHQE